MKKWTKLQNKAEQAMKEAVKEVIENHKKTGRPIPVWKNNKVTMIPAGKVSARAGN